MKKPIWVTDLPEPIITLMFAGKVYYYGLFDDLYKALSKNLYDEKGVGAGHLARDIHIEFEVGKQRVKTMQELVNLVKWTQDNTVCNVIFEQGSFTDTSILDYKKVYEDHGLVIVFREPFFQFAIKDTLPDSWKPEATGYWGPHNIKKPDV